MSAKLLRTVTDTLLTANATFTFDLTTAATEGNVLLAFISNDGSGTTSGPVGWVEIFNNVPNAATVTQSAWYKVAGASEGTTYDWTNTSSEKWKGVMWEVVNIDSSDPLDTYSITSALNAAPISPSINVANDGSFLVSGFGHNSTSTTVSLDVSLTESINSESLTSDSTGICAGYAIQDSGASGTFTHGITLSSRDNTAFTIALNPSPAIHIGTVSTHEGTAASADTTISSHTIDTESDAVIIILAGENEPASASPTPVWDSTGDNISFDLIGSRVSSGSCIYAFGKTGITPGTADIFIDHEFGSFAIAVYNLAGVNQTTPWGNFQSAAVSTTTLSLSGFTADTNTTVFASGGQITSSVYTPTSPAVQIHSTLEETAKNQSLRSIYEYNTTDIEMTSTTTSVGSIIGFEVYGNSSVIITKNKYTINGKVVLESNDTNKYLNNGAIVQETSTAEEGGGGGGAAPIINHLFKLMNQ